MDEEHIYEFLENLDKRISEIEKELQQPMHDVIYKPAVQDASFKSVLRQLCEKIGRVLNAVVTEKLEYKFYVQVIHHAVESAKDTVSQLNINDDRDWALVVEAIKTLFHKMQLLSLISWTIDKRLSDICKSVADGTNINEDAMLKTGKTERNQVMLNLFKLIGINLLHITRSGQNTDRNYFKFLGKTSSNLMWEIITLLTGGQVETMGR
jgi:hypothetical protein